MTDPEVAALYRSIQDVRSARKHDDVALERVDKVRYHAARGMSWERLEVIYGWRAVRLALGEG